MIVKQIYSTEKDQLLGTTKTGKFGCKLQDIMCFDAVEDDEGNPLVNITLRGGITRTVDLDDSQKEVLANHFTKG